MDVGKVRLVWIDFCWGGNHGVDMRRRGTDIVVCWCVDSCTRE